MLNMREVAGFFVLVALVVAAGQTQFVQNGFHHFLDAVNLWYYRMVG
jgi:hypothetical protein